MKFTLTDQARDPHTISPSLRARLAQASRTEHAFREAILAFAFARHGVERTEGESEVSFGGQMRSLLLRHGHEMHVGEVCLYCSCGWLGSGPYAMSEHAVSVLRSTDPPEDS